MNKKNNISKVIDIFGNEIINTLHDITKPFTDNIEKLSESTKIYTNESTDYVFICIELPGVIKENCKIEITNSQLKLIFKTNYELSTSNEITPNDFLFIKNKELSEIIDLSKFNIDESFVYANFINGLLKIKLKKKPKTNINID